MIDFVINLAESSGFMLTLYVVFYGLCILTPIALVYFVWNLWILHVRAIFFSKQEYVLLEIKPPKEIFKSPQAMEFCISAMYSTLGEGNWYEKYWKGQVRIYHSLEIVSIDGQVKFFIWTRKGAKKQIESNIYSQFPGIEIFEVPDYTKTFSYDKEKHGMWVTEFKLTKDDVYPIKTYVDYGLADNPDEEYKIDPLTPLIEFLGSLDRGNQVWIQIIIRAHKAEDRDPVTKKMVDLKWENAAKTEIEKIIKNAKGEVVDGKIVPGTGRQLTDIEKDTINALGRSVSKKGFDVGIRVIYHAPKDVFSMGNVGGIVTGIMHFNSPMNGFVPTGTTSPKYKLPFLVWKDRNPKIFELEKQEFLDAYKKRQYFYAPHNRQYFVLNTEELATIFHFPGGVSTTPTFTRVESRKADAPANLPI